MALFALGAWAQNARVVLRWRPVESARRYQLQISRDDKFKEVLVDQMLDEPVFRWDELPNVTYQWRVRSYDADGRPSQWSAARAITAAAAAPTPKGPASGATVDCRFEGLDLAVEKQEVFKEYLLDLAEDPAFSTSAQQQRGTSSVFRVTLAPGRWYWKMRAVDLASRDTESTPVQTLNVALAAPRPRPTADVGLGQRAVALEWDDVPCATRYQVEAQLESEPSVPLAASGTSAAFKAQRAGEYQWRVAALDARGVPGSFSAWSPFRVRLPAPVARADSSGRDAELAWASVPQAVSYRVEVAAASDFKPLITQASVEGLGWKPGLLPGGTYFWRVFARDASGHLSLPSELRRWTVPDAAPPPLPELLEPAAGNVERPESGDLTVRWTADPKAANFELQLDDGPIIGAAGSSYPFRALPQGPHTVRLRARGPGGTPSEWAQREFTFGVPPVARVELAALEVVLGSPATVLELETFDAAGQPIPGSHVTAAALKGKVGEPRATPNGFTVAYTPPGLSTRLEEDTLVVESGAFRKAVRVPLRRGAFAAGLHLGARFNGGAVVSPTFDVGVAVRPGWLWGRLTFELRGGVYAAGATVPLSDGTAVVARTQLLPLSLLAAWTQPWLGLEWRLALGPTVQLAFVQVDDDASFTALPGFDSALGAGKALGPGVLEVQVGFLYSRLAAQVVLQAGGLGIAVGYRVDLPALAH